MSYFIDLEQKRIVVRPPGSVPESGQVVVDGETAQTCELSHGQVLSDEQIQALRDGSIGSFRAITNTASDVASTQARTPVPAPPSPHGPAASEQAKSAFTLWGWATAFALMSWFATAIVAFSKWSNLHEAVYPSGDEWSYSDLPTNEQVIADAAYNGQTARLFIVISVLLTFAALTAGINLIVKTMQK